MAVDVANCAAAARECGECVGFGHARRITRTRSDRWLAGAAERACCRSRRCQRAVDDVNEVSASDMHAELRARSRCRGAVDDNLLSAWQRPIRSSFDNLFEDVDAADVTVWPNGLPNRLVDESG